MSNRTLILDEPLYHYLLANSLREHPQQAALRAATRSHPRAGMQISPEQGALMQVLVQLMGARRCLEIGVFTGYSALTVALALPADGYLLACDIAADTTAIGLPYWQRAGVAGRIELALGPALATLDERLARGAAGSFDFAFIDADKANYDSYYERCLQLLRGGGLVAIDNVLWSGRVARADQGDPDTVALRRLNAKLLKDERVDLAMVPIGDGLTLARKRELS
jgi:caffeoyl-CoA O-methyltransferase